MHKILRTFLTGAAALALTAGGLTAAGSSAQATALTPWTNYYTNIAHVKGVSYTLYFTGAGKHEYEKVNPNGCNMRLAKKYSVSIYPTSSPSNVVYRATMDGLHYLYATEGNTFDTSKYKSVSALIKALKKRLNASAKEAAWGSGGKELAQSRTYALGDDLMEAWESANTYAVRKAKKIAAAQPVDPERGAANAGDFIDAISFDGFDLGSYMKSTKHYGTGCLGENGQAQFKRKISITGTFAEHTIIETDLDDNVTIGSVSPAPAGQHYFRIVNGERVYFPSAIKAAAVFR